MRLIVLPVYSCSRDESAVFNGGVLACAQLGCAALWPAQREAGAEQRDGGARQRREQPAAHRDGVEQAVAELSELCVVCGERV